MERLSDAALRELATPRRCECHTLAAIVEVIDDEPLPENVRCPLCNRPARRAIVLSIESAGGGCQAITEEELETMFASDPYPEDVRERT